MRTIKFRAWDKKLNKMLYLDDDTCLEFHNGYWVVTECRPGGWDTIVDEESGVLMESTGLHDKNGKEIYEGDVVVCDGGHGGQYWHGEVVWKDYGWVAIYHNGKRYFNHPSEYEVLGNVWENPELLEANDE